MGCKMEGKAHAEYPDELPVLGREAILGVEDKEVELVEVPEWGGSVFVRCMTGRERDQLEASISGGVGGKTSMSDFRARFASLVICDSEGARMFSDADIEALSNKSAAALDRVFDAGKRLNRIGAEEQEALVKN